MHCETKTKFYVRKKIKTATFSSKNTWVTSTKFLVINVGSLKNYICGHRNKKPFERNKNIKKLREKSYGIIKIRIPTKIHRRTVTIILIFEKKETNMK